MNKAVWFARHELRLAMREVMWMLSAGKPRRQKMALVLLLVLAAFLHFVAWAIVAPYAKVTFPPDRTTLVVITGSAFLGWTVMISQAMESVTRAFYTRADLDLLLSSPAPTRLIFVLRVGAIGITTSLLALILIGPFINALAYAGGIHWLSAYGVLFAMSATAAALAVGMTILLFRTIGPRRTRFVAQVVAAIVGAVFVIGVQAISIFAYGSLSRFDALHSSLVMQHMPDLDSPFWLPARAAMGDIPALILVMGLGFSFFALAVSVASRRFGEFAVAAAGAGAGNVRQRAKRKFRGGSATAALRRKEWTLLIRDPWLVSQSMMQILYLIPPALLLWRNYGSDNGNLVVLAPVLVMASGQLAGGLAWLAISGEDAPDLVSTAPIKTHAVIRAKTEAVIGSVAIVLAPIVAAIATASLWIAFVTSVGIVVAAASSTTIQLFFRAQAKRSNFRRRQTSSRIATFAEAFSSIGWAAAAGLTAAGSLLAIPAGVLAVLVLALARLLRPRDPALRA